MAQLALRTLPEAIRRREMIVVATAGWSIPRRVAARFPGDETHLQRYAQLFRGVEIDTSFYRPHSVETYARWASLTPRQFRFAVKVPREITHDQRLRAARRPLSAFLASVAGLGQRLGPLIIQLPPSQPFESRVVRRFLSLLRDHHAGQVVCEPRHASWFETNADRMLNEYRIGRVAADPAVVDAAACPGGWGGLIYYRLHGSPRKYWSVYDDKRLAMWSMHLRSTGRRIPVWCVFDNTAAGGAASNALTMLESLGSALS
jgi:uncharacterized protein YecE (DUF72 family)